MKKLIFLLPFAFFGCDTDDDGYYNVKYIVSDEPLVNIETLPDYNVNDVLYVNAEIPFLLAEEGSANLIDIPRSTGNTPEFEISYSLQRQVSENVWEPVDLTGDFVSDIGEGQSGFYVSGTTDTQADAYVFRGGLRLDSTGTFRLVFSTNAKNDSMVTLRSHSTGNNLELNIQSAVEGVTGFYTFTVD